MNEPEINMMFFAPTGFWHERQIRESLAEIKAHGAQPAVDVIGVDGPVRGHSTKKESIFDSAPRFFEIVKRHGKRAFALAETFDSIADDDALLDAQMPRVPDLDADVYSFNYYGHGNVHSDRVMQAVWSGMAAVRGK